MYQIITQVGQENWTKKNMGYFKEKSNQKKMKN